MVGWVELAALVEGARAGSDLTLGSRLMVGRAWVAGNAGGRV